MQRERLPSTASGKPWRHGFSIKKERSAFCWRRGRTISGRRRRIRGTCSTMTNTGWMATASSGGIPTDRRASGTGGSRRAYRGQRDRGDRVHFPRWGLRRFLWRIVTVVGVIHPPTRKSGVVPSAKNLHSRRQRETLGSKGKHDQHPHNALSGNKSPRLRSCAQPSCLSQVR